MGISPADQVCQAAVCASGNQDRHRDDEEVSNDEVDDVVWILLRG